MKTPEKIKKGLEYCRPIWKSDHWKKCDEKCPYSAEASFCKNVLNTDALALIQQLEADLKQEKADHQHTYECAEVFQNENAELSGKIRQLEKERDALFEALRTNRHICNSCKHNPGHGYGCTSVAKVDGSCWEWRGPYEEKTENH